jgi:hypothetical protein
MIFACTLLIVSPGIARAEGFFDLYGGPVISGTADIRVSETSFSGTTSDAASVDLTSTTFGARIGVWHPTYSWVGLGMDTGYLKASGPGVDIDAFPLSFLLALRAPLFPTPERPGGRFQPYVMAGLSIYLADVTVDVGGMGGSSLQGGSSFYGSSGDAVLGPYLAAGLAWQPARSLAIFCEYRYLNFDVGFDTVSSYFFPTVAGTVDTSVKADYLLFGISYRFLQGAPVMEARP